MEKTHRKPMLLEGTIDLIIIISVVKRRQAMYVKCNIEARLCHHFFHGKAISITYYECVSVALGIQHTDHMHCIILSPVARLAVLYFSTLSHKTSRMLGKKVC